MTSSHQKKYRSSDTEADRNALKDHRRSSRIIEDRGQYYFQTREGINVGPYSSQFDAELSASLLISRLAQLDIDQNSRSEIVHFLNTSEYLARKITQPVVTDASVEPRKGGLLSQLLSRVLHLFLFRSTIPRRS